MNHLPLTLPLRYLGMSDAEVDQIDSDCCNHRSARPMHATTIGSPGHVSVDPVRGLDPLTARARSWKVPAAYWAPRFGG